MLCDWSRKIAPLHQPIEFKTNTNYDLVARVFPRSMGGLCNFSVDFHWLVTVSYFLPSGCCFWFWFWSYDNHQSKSALFTTESTGRLHYVFLVIIIVDIKRTKSIRVMNKLWKLPIEITSGSEYLNNVSVNQRICGLFFFHFHGPFQASFLWNYFLGRRPSRRHDLQLDGRQPRPFPLQTRINAKLQKMSPTLRKAIP